MNRPDIPTETTMRRRRAINWLRAYLVRRGIPRVHMFFMVTGTGLAGFLASALMLWMGFDTMWLRYGLAVLVAYGVFLGFIWLWIQYYRQQIEFDVNVVDAIDVVDGVTDVMTQVAQNRMSTGRVEPPGSMSDFDFSFDLDGDDLVVVAAILAALGVAAMVSVYLVWSAPVLLGEVMLDALLSAVLYRRLRQVERRHWIESAFVRTRFPVLLLLAVFVLAGIVMQWYAPDARSIGGVWNQYRMKQASRRSASP
jgi:hypothetical protein